MDRPKPEEQEPPDEITTEGLPPEAPAGDRGEVAPEDED
jgi:hypothetical protein